MLAEWLTHITTPCQKPFRKMGYLGELIAIKHRHARCQQAWKPHLDKCKSLIKDAVTDTTKKGSVVVLGSGQLLDIPIEFLSQHFDTVHLVDICHLRNSRKRTANLKNIHWVEADISGTVEPLQNWDPRTPLPAPSPDIALLKTADFVISSNLLAQLPLAPLHYIKAKMPAPVSLNLEAYGRQIMDQHLSMLGELNCPVTLISEVEHIVSNGDQILEKTAPLSGIQLPPPNQEWWWNLAPRPELSPDFDLKLKVAAIANLNASA